MAELADHPYIVQVFQADVTADGRPYIVMKYYPQRDMALRAKQEKLSVPQVLQIGVRITCAVETAHRAGILHGDIKPANILTSQYGEPGLTDFGIAKRTTAGAEEDSQGLSVPWSAPEVVFASAVGDRTADVYSIGATLWHLLVGHSPFEQANGDNSTPVLMRRIRESPVPNTGRGDVPRALERLLAQAMAKRPADRPQTALQLARSLQAVETEQRWAPTPLVLLEEHSEQNRVEDGETQDGDLKTRQKQPSLVVAQKSSPSPLISSPPKAPDDLVSNSAVAAPSAASEVSRPPRARQSKPALLEEDHTIRRPVVVAPAAEADAEPRPAPNSIGRVGSWKILLVSVVVLGAVIGAGVALSGHNSPHSPRTRPTVSPPTVVVPATPDSPMVTWARLNNSQVQFKWTDPGAKPGDSFEWEEPGGTPQATAARSVTLPAGAGQQVCITVELVRDGLDAYSLKSCAGGS